MNKVEIYTEELRNRLQVVMGQTPLSVRQLCIKIGISYPTLASFLKGTRPTRMHSLSRIESYIRSHSERKELPGTHTETEGA